MGKFEKYLTENKVDWYDVEDAVNQEFDTYGSESEMDDYRIDLTYDSSIWFRRGGGSYPDSVEGSAPRRFKSKLDQIIKRFKLKNFIEYM